MKGKSLESQEEELVTKRTTASTSIYLSLQDNSAQLIRLQSIIST